MNLADPDQAFRPHKSQLKKAFAGAMCAVFLYSTIAAPLAEANFWSERRKQVEQNRSRDLQPMQLAALPASPPDLPQVLNSLPTLQASSLSSALSERLSKAVPKNLLPAYEPIFRALPPAYGTIRKIFVSADKQSPIVIHIQDVHMNDEAQRNIASAVRQLVDGNRADMVALEGAFTPIDLQRFRDFPQHDAVRAAADYMLEQKKISGPIHTLLTDLNPFPPVVGIDQKEHYDANVEAYKRSAPMVDEYRRRLSALTLDLNGRKRKSFSPALLSFDQTVEAYHRKNLPLGEYVRVITAEKSEIADGAGALDSFRRALRIEQTLDFKQVERERGVLLQELVARMKQRDIAELMSVAYHNGSARYADFYSFIEKLCLSCRVDLARYPAMKTYLEYVLLSDGIDSTELFKEMQAEEDAGYAALVKTSQEQALLAESKRLMLTEKLLDFSLTPEEWETYKASSVRLHEFDLSSFESFYREADIRSQAMTDNLLKGLSEHHAKVAVLVTGGFHSEELEGLMRRRGISYITYAPKITKVDSTQGSAYLSVFTQEKTPLEKLFEGEKLFVAPLQVTKGIEGTLAAGTLAVANRSGDVTSELRALAADLKIAEAEIEQQADAAEITIAQPNGIVHSRILKSNSRINDIRQTVRPKLRFIGQAVNVASFVRRLFFPAADGSVPGGRPGESGPGRDEKQTGSAKISRRTLLGSVAAIPLLMLRKKPVSSSVTAVPGTPAATSAAATLTDAPRFRIRSRDDYKTIAAMLENLNGVHASKIIIAINQAGFATEEQATTRLADTLAVFRQAGVAPTDELICYFILSAKPVAELRTTLIAINGIFQGVLFRNPEAAEILVALGKYSAAQDESMSILTVEKWIRSLLEAQDKDGISKALEDFYSSRGQTLYPELRRDLIVRWYARYNAAGKNAASAGADLSAVLVEMDRAYRGVFGDLLAGRDRDQAVGAVVDGKSLEDLVKPRLEKYLMNIGLTRDGQAEDAADQWLRLFPGWKSGSDGSIADRDNFAALFVAMGWTWTAIDTITHYNPYCAIDDYVNGLINTTPENVDAMRAGRQPAIWGEEYQSANHFVFDADDNLQKVVINPAMGSIAVDRDIIPLGSSVVFEIPEDSPVPFVTIDEEPVVVAVFWASDTGGAVNGAHIDMGYDIISAGLVDWLHMHGLTHVLNDSGSVNWILWENFGAWWANLQPLMPELDDSAAWQLFADLKKFRQNQLKFDPVINWDNWSVLVSPTGQKTRPAGLTGAPSQAPFFRLFGLNMAQDVFESVRSRIGFRGWKRLDELVVDSALYIAVHPLIGAPLWETGLLTISNGFGLWPYSFGPLVWIAVLVFNMLLFSILHSDLHSIYERILEIRHANSDRKPTVLEKACFFISLPEFHQRMIGGFLLGIPFYLPIGLLHQVIASWAIHMIWNALSLSGRQWYILWIRSLLPLRIAAKPIERKALIQKIVSRVSSSRAASWFPVMAEMSPRYNDFAQIYTRRLAALVESPGLYVAVYFAVHLMGHGSVPAVFTAAFVLPHLWPAAFLIKEALRDELKLSEAILCGLRNCPLRIELFVVGGLSFFVGQLSTTLSATALVWWGVLILVHYAIDLYSEKRRRNIEQVRAVAELVAYIEIRVQDRVELLIRIGNVASRPVQNGVTPDQAETYANLIEKLIEMFPLNLGLSGFDLASSPNPLVTVDNFLTGGARNRRIYLEMVRDVLVEELSQSTEFSLTNAKAALMMGNAMVETQQDAEHIVEAEEPVKRALADTELNHNAVNRIFVNPAWPKESIARWVKAQLKLSPDKCQFVVPDDTTRRMVLSAGAADESITTDANAYMMADGVPVLKMDAIWNGGLKFTPDSVNMFVASGIGFDFGQMDRANIEAMRQKITLYIVNELLNTMDIPKEHFEDQIWAIIRMLQSA